MLPEPQVGQIVRYEKYEGKLIVKKVSEDGGSVDLVSESDPSHILNHVPCTELLPPEGVDVG